jgi:uncharacterized membrane protein YbaN (DUF454 family)
MAKAGWTYVKPILMQVLGYFFLVLGVLGMFLPILQGFLFLFIGLLILARYATWAQRLLDHIRSRHPAFDRMINQAETTTHVWGQRSKATMRYWWAQTRLQFSRFIQWLASPRPAKKRCRCQPDQ